MPPPRIDSIKNIDRDLDYRVHTDVMGLKYYTDKKNLPDTSNDDMILEPSKITYVTTTLWNEIHRGSPLMNIELVPYYSSNPNDAIRIQSVMSEHGFATNTEYSPDKKSIAVGFFMMPLTPQTPQGLAQHETISRAACFAALAALEDKKKKSELLKKEMPNEKRDQTGAS